MSDFRYARGRITETLSFIAGEMAEFEKDYSDKTMQQYAADSKLQKLVDRTIENILTACIESGGAILAENDIQAESYPDVMRKTGAFLGFAAGEQELLAKLAIQRNRLAHRYLNFRWMVVKLYKENSGLLKKLVNAIHAYAEAREGE